jgi:hypothetical protein
MMSNDLLLLATSHSYGDRTLKGERSVDVALRGESLPGTAGDCGMRGRPINAEGGADVGYVNGDGRTADAGDLWVSQLQEQLL